MIVKYLSTVEHRFVEPVLFVSTKSIEYNTPTSLRHLNVKTKVEIYAELYGDI